MRPRHKLDQNGSCLCSRHIILLDWQKEVYSTHPALRLRSELKSIDWPFRCYVRWIKHIASAQTTYKYPMKHSTGCCRFFGCTPAFHRQGLIWDPNRSSHCHFSWSAASLLSQLRRSLPNAVFGTSSFTQWDLVTNDLDHPGPRRTKLWCPAHQLLQLDNSPDGIDNTAKAKDWHGMVLSEFWMAVQHDCVSVFLDVPFDSVKCQKSTLNHTPLCSVNRIVSVVQWARSQPDKVQHVITTNAAEAGQGSCPWGLARAYANFVGFIFITASDSYFDLTNETVPCGWRCDCCCCCCVAFVAALLAAVLHLLLVLLAFGFLQLLLFLLSPWLSLFLGVGFYSPKVLLWSNADLPSANL